MTNEEAKEFLDNLKICINEHPVVADWLVEIANRKDEPTISKMEQVADEPQKNCYTCRHLRVCDIRDITNEFCRYESRYDPQTCSVSGRPYSECADCGYFKCTADEPQTERSGE